MVFFFSFVWIFFVKGGIKGGVWLRLLVSVLGLFYGGVVVVGKGGGSSCSLGYYLDLVRRRRWVLEFFIL